MNLILLFLFCSSYKTKLTIITCSFVMIDTIDYNAFHKKKFPMESCLNSIVFVKGRIQIYTTSLNLKNENDVENDLQKFKKNIILKQNAIALLLDTYREPRTYAYTYILKTFSEIFVKVTNKLF